MSSVLSDTQIPQIGSLVGCNRQTLRHNMTDKTTHYKSDRQGTSFNIQTLWHNTTDETTHHKSDRQGTSFTL